MTVSNRGRALALILIVFVVGGVAGAAIDRAWLRRAAPVAWSGNTEPRRDNRRAEIAADRIPMPLEALQLTTEETSRLHEIARRWRPQGARLTDSVRTIVADLENDMFAEMLCAISNDKQARYLAQLQENGAPPAMIDKRFRLVRANACASIRQ